MSNNKQSMKPLIAVILTMIGFYLLVSFAIWDLNASHWAIGARVLYALFSPIFSGLAYSIIKIEQKQ
jgi:hypothetical protein